MYNNKNINCDIKNIKGNVESEKIEFFGTNAGVIGMK